MPDPDARKILEHLFAQLYRRRAPAEPPPFPPATEADAYGWVTQSARLTPELVLLAYRQGIFPMAEPDGSVGWWSPDPRAVIELSACHVPRRLARTTRQGRFEVRVDTSFEQVIRGCADRDETWIDERFVEVYTELQRQGHVHSVETWRQGVLVGGLYGVALGGAFMAESMFHRERDASKVAVVALVERLRTRGYELLDIQYETKATSVFRPRRVPRREYLERLARALTLPRTFRDGEP